MQESPLRHVLQDPNSVLDWTNDWSAWLVVGDSIAARQWSVTPAATLANDTAATVTVSGLTDGKVYKLVEHVTTANGRQADRTIVIRCANR